MKTRAMLRVTPELFVQFLTTVREGAEPRAFRVVKNGLPEDSRLVRVCFDARDDIFLFLLESEHFDVPSDALVHDSGYPYLEPPQMTVEYFK